jgi:hypothetical protein
MYLSQNRTQISTYAQPHAYKLSTRGWDRKWWAWFGHCDLTYPYLNVRHTRYPVAAECQTRNIHSVNAHVCIYCIGLCEADVVMLSSEGMYLK